MAFPHTRPDQRHDHGYDPGRRHRPPHLRQLRQSATYEAKFGTTSLYSVSYVRDSLAGSSRRPRPSRARRRCGLQLRLGWPAVAGDAERVLSATYLYDANGNRLSKTGPSGTETAHVRRPGSAADVREMGLHLHGERRIEDQGGHYHRTGHDIQLRRHGNLRHVALPDGRAIDYVIDSLDRRVAKKVNGAVVRQWL